MADKKKQSALVDKAREMYGLNASPLKHYNASTDGALDAQGGYLCLNEQTLKVVYDDGPKWPAIVKVSMLTSNNIYM